MMRGAGFRTNFSTSQRRFDKPASEKNCQAAGAANGLKQKWPTRLRIGQISVLVNSLRSKSINNHDQANRILRRSHRILFRLFLCQFSVRQSPRQFRQ